MDESELDHSIHCTAPPCKGTDPLKFVCEGIVVIGSFKGKDCTQAFFDAIAANDEVQASRWCERTTGCALSPVQTVASVANESSNSRRQLQVGKKDVGQTSQTGIANSLEGGVNTGSTYANYLIMDIDPTVITVTAQTNAIPVTQSVVLLTSAADVSIVRHYPLSPPPVDLGWADSDTRRTCAYCSEQRRRGGHGMYDRL
jgi:hypothetical protein